MFWVMEWLQLIQNWLSLKLGIYQCFVLNRLFQIRLYSVVYRAVMSSTSKSWYTLFYCTHVVVRIHIWETYSFSCNQILVPTLFMSRDAFKSYCFWSNCSKKYNSSWLCEHQFTLRNISRRKANELWWPSTTVCSYSTSRPFDCSFIIYFHKHHILKTIV